MNAAGLHPSPAPALGREFEPNESLIISHLKILFDGLPPELQDGLIELAWTDAAEGRSSHGRLCHSRLFLPSDIAEAARVAKSHNSVPGQNVYVGAALRRPGTSRERRASDKDFYALTAFYADFDNEGALAAAEAACLAKGVPPTAKVITGRMPYPRGQLWWRLENSLTDPDFCRQQNRIIAETLGGDTSVVNPGRVMRLAGSVAWPMKPGRVAEMTELVA